MAGYRMAENGTDIVAKDGLPVYDRDGEEGETLVNYDSFIREVGSANSESKARKIEIKKLKEQFEKYKAFDGLDPEEITRAIEVMQNMDQKTLIDAGEKDVAVKQAIENIEKKYGPMVAGFEQKVAELSETLKKKDSYLHKQEIKRVVANSPYLSKNTTMTPDVMEMVFGPRFRTEEVNGVLKPIAYKANGEKLYSHNNLSELATPEEALETFFKQYEYRDNYTPGGHSGSGSSGNQGSGKTVFTTDEWQSRFEKADQLERASMAKQIINNEVQVK